MPRKREEPWASFARWLRSERGLTVQSASNYVTHTRRIIRDVPTLAPAKLDAYVEDLVRHYKSPYKSAWRAFVEWSAADRSITVPTFTPLTTSTLPDAVQGAVRILRQDGISAAKIIRLVWDVFDDPILTSTMPTRLWLRADEDADEDAYPVSKAAVKALREWGYPHRDSPPSASDPVVPRGPNDRRPMQLALVRRILSGHTRNARR